MPITDSEKARRRRLLKAHYDVENSHDMSGIMATFSPDGDRTHPVRAPVLLFLGT